MYNSFLFIFYYDDDTIEWNTPHLYNGVRWACSFYNVHNAMNETIIFSRQNIIRRNEEGKETTTNKQKTLRNSNIRIVRSVQNTQKPHTQVQVNWKSVLCSGSTIRTFLLLHLCFSFLCSAFHKIRITFAIQKATVNSYAIYKWKCDTLNYRHRYIYFLLGSEKNVFDAHGFYFGMKDETISQ